ncbi:ATP-binding cassette sub-family A member [Dirofilaria immitis]
MFNNYALHSPPLAINLADIAMISESIQRNISIQAYGHIGYGPQFDIGEMTGQETLRMFAQLRGIRECDST